MVLGDTIITANATIMVGLIFLVSLRRALGIPVTAAALANIGWPMAWLFLSTLCVFLGEDEAFVNPLCKLQGASSCPTMGNMFFLVFSARVLFLVGIMFLPLALRGIQREAEMKERLVGWMRAIKEMRSQANTDDERELLDRAVERAKRTYGRELVETVEKELRSDD
jgi:hypothetical protein